MITPQKCKICNKEFVHLRPHLRSHKITWQEYEAKYSEKVSQMDFRDKRPEELKLIERYQREAYRRLKEVK